MAIVHHTVFQAGPTPGAAPFKQAVPATRTLMVALALVMGMSRYAGAQTATLPLDSTLGASGRGAAARVAGTAGRGLGGVPQGQLARTIVPSARGSSLLRLPITARPTGLSTIQGSTLNFTNTPAPNTAVRLRNARNGRIVGTATTDEAGQFVFGDITPGSYIAEVLDQSQHVISASQLIGANADQIASVSLKLPSKLSLLSKALGPTSPALTAQVAGVATGVFQPSISER